MADRFTLPRIRAADAITGQDGKAVNAFVRFWDTVCRKIEGQESNQDAILVDLQAIVAQLQANTAATQAAQQTANDAQATADGASAKSGAAIGEVSLEAAWFAGPQVDLTGVIAGTLTIPGTGPQQNETLFMSGGKGSVDGVFRVVEIVGITETTVYTGSLRVLRSTPDLSETPTVSNLSSTEVANFSGARSSTGAVSYRLDFQRSSGSRVVNGMGAYLFVRRA